MYTYLFLLIIILTVLIYTLPVSKTLRDVKKKYKVLINHIKTNSNIPKKFKILEDPILISGFKIPSNDEIGYNVNKGTEIGLCLDGNSNHAFHVLLHELAHSTVEEYSHSKEFWNNFKELCKISENLGIYTAIDKQTKFCGKYIRD